MSISLNVLAQPAINTAELIAWCAAARPPFVVVMDEIEVGRRVQMASPTTQIVFRRYRPDDAKLHETIKPAEFLASVADVPADWLVQALNEPGGDQVLLTSWCVALIGQADAIGRRLALPNWSVGNPDDERTAAGLYDRLLQALAASGRHYLSTHEYFHDAPLEEPYFIRRYGMFLRRAVELGIARPQVLITEHGRDLGGGGDGWRAQGWSEADYARRLEEAQQVYQADGVCACVFSFGAGFDQRWQTYNVEGARELLARMAGMNDGNIPEEPEGDDMVPGYGRARTKQAGANVNLRGGPGLKHAPVGVVRTGDWVKRLPGSTVAADGYTWAQIALDREAGSHQHGWVATEVIEV